MARSIWRQRHCGLLFEPDVQDEQGVTFIEFITRRKLEAAAKLPAENKYSVNEIASMLGSQSTNHFIRIFKEDAEAVSEIRGVTPTATFTFLPASTWLGAKWLYDGERDAYAAPSCVETYRRRSWDEKNGDVLNGVRCARDLRACCDGGRVGAEFAQDDYAAS
ncbi:MAG: helix-turn-helix domain-containing protein [Paenibacillaceae bacterium]|nr:helix-turn-helix domain-containing protein [Paenibacillaceae bacterium]